MSLSIKEANLRRKDPLGYELQILRTELSNMKSGGLKEIAELVFERKVKEIKADILSQLEAYVGDVTETLIRENLKGETGEKGDTGERGPKGEMGATGPMGLQGIPGVEGSRGKDGIDGQNGISGKNGKDGKSVELEAVLAVIKPEVNRMLEEAKKIIKSLRPDRQANGGGGGMSKPETFSFTGNGADTAFTLSSKVAASGMAIWAHVNGQWIQPGVHFTVSNRTFSTTFTPADGDVIEGFYFRA